MKKLLLPLLLIAASVVSCQKDNTTVNDNTTREIRVSINAGAPDTKTSIAYQNGEYVPYWNKGDAIYVMIDLENTQNEFKNQNSEPSETCTFSKTLSVSTGTHTLNATYPKRSGQDSATKAYKFNAVKKQTLPSLSSFDASADLLISNPETITVDESTTDIEVNSLRFYRMKGVLKVILADATDTKTNLISDVHVTGITIESSSDDVVFASKVSINLATGEITKYEEKTNYLEASYSGNDWTIDGTSAAYLLSFPTTLPKDSDLTITVSTDDESLEIKKTVTLSKDIDILANYVKPLKINITDDCIRDVPVIHAENTSIAFDATSGSFTFTVDKAIEGVSPTVAWASGDWIAHSETDGPVVSGPIDNLYTVSFNCEKNDSVEATVRNGVITISYPGATTKSVTVTQGINSSAVTENVFYYYFDSTNSNTLINTQNKFEYTYNGSVTTDSNVTFKANDTGNYNAASFIVDGITYTGGSKFDSKGLLSFSTSADVSSVEITLYYACRKSSDYSAAKMLIIPGTGSNINCLYNEEYGKASYVTESLSPDTSYQIKQGSKEQALILVKLIERTAN